MQKKTRFKSPLRDALVISFCLSCAALFLFLFWRDLNSSTTRNDKTRIATISFKNRIAQRKFSDRVVWERVNQNSPVYDGDIIRTADLAQATLHFEDGTSLDLYENTMIQIAYSKDGGLQISVDGGDVQVESAKDSSVALVLDDGSKITVDAGASLAAKSDAMGARSVEVKSGTASVVTEAGAVAALVTGESVSVDKSGEIQKRPVTVTSIPKELKILHLYGGSERAVSGAESVPVQLAWNVAEALPVTVELSRKKDFSELLFTDTVSQKNTELTLSDGAFYWRVYTEDSPELGASGRISVERLESLSLIAPGELSDFRYRVKTPRIHFRWSGNDFAQSYTLTVSDTPDMRSVVYQVQTNDTFCLLDTLPEGSYFWQVSPEYSLQHVGTGESAVHAFSVVKNDALSAPELTIPADGARIVRRGDVNQTFMWKSELKDALYELVVSRDADFTDIALKRETALLRLSEKIDADTLPDGSYYWKIVRRALSESDRADDLAPESAVRAFSIEPYIPQENKLLFPPDGYSAEMAKLSDTSFMWKLSDDAPREAVSVIQIAKNADFSAMQLERTQSRTSLENLLLAPGTYWWRVGLKNADGSVEGLTASRSFTVLKELVRPVITEPRADESVLSYNGSPVSVRWNAVDGADYYDVRVLSKDGSLIENRQQEHTNSCSLVLSPESYTVRVQPIAAETETSALRVGEGAAVSFSVREPERITGVFPAQDAHVAGLTALRTDTAFRWKSGRDKASSYNFVLYKLQHDGSLREVERIENAVSALSLPRLTAGSYRWRVLASTKDGFPLDSALSSFTIDGVIPLTRPVLTSPANKLVMDFAYLRKNRTITFSWLPVSGATDYTFVLYKKDAGGTLTAVSTERLLSSPQVKLKKLSMLDVGDFVWTVTAFSHAKDGFEEQRSEAVSGEFRVSFDRPKKIETIKPERMYAD